VEYGVKRVAERVIESVKSEIYLNLKFTWIALERLSFQIEEGGGEPKTDGNRVSVGAEYLFSTYRENHRIITRALVHTTVHCLFRHFFTGGGENPKLWNLATDIFAEKAVDDLRLPFLTDGMERQRQRVYEELQISVPLFTAEGIYGYFARLEKEGKPLPPRELFYRDSHELWSRPGDETSFHKGEEEEKTAEEWKEIAGKVLADLQFFHPESGEAMRKSLQAETRKKLSYRAFLKKMLALKERIKEDPDEFDYVFYSYGLSLYKNMPLIEQLEYKEEASLATLCVVIDTSCSTYHGLVQKFLNETYAVICSTARGKFLLRVIQCDEKVRKDDVVESFEQLSALTQNFTVLGGGGTDFRPAFTYIDSLIEQGELSNLKGVIYFTDGKGIYPKKPTPYETAFVFYDESYEDKNVPPWAMKLVVGEKEITEK